MSKVALKVHLQSGNRTDVFNYMTCGMAIRFDDHNYRTRITRRSDKVTCNNCKRIQP